MNETQRLLSVTDEIADEVAHARDLFPPHHSPHESLGVIEEEFIEFRDEVCAFNLRKGRDTRAKMRTELIQLAAMAVRAILDLDLPKETK